MDDTKETAPLGPSPAEGAAADDDALKSLMNGNRGRTERSETPYPYFGLSHGIGVVQAVRRAGGNEASSRATFTEI